MLDNSFWTSLLKRSNDLKKTCVVKNALAPELIQKLKNGAHEVLMNRTLHEELSQGFRLYLEGEEQTESFSKQFIQKNHILEHETIEQYTRRVFDKKFGMIINFAERHSDLLSHELIKHLSPLINLKGTPPLGVYATIFIGNYGWTPLGIHQDRKGESYLHFHLGPGDKKMHVWDEEVYKNVADGLQNNHEIEPILQHANEYSFSTGDLYYMPWNNYHVGFTGNLSIGVVIGFNRPTKRRLLEEVFESFQLQYTKDDDLEISSNRQNLVTDQETYQDILSQLKLEEEVLNSSVKNLLQLTSSEFNFCLSSNAGWTTPPLSQTTTSNFDINNYDSFRNKQIAGIKPFKILHKKKHDQLTVYVRGSKFSMNNYDDLVVIIEKINTYKSICVQELLKELTPDFPEEAALFFISTIYDKKGVQIMI